MSAAPATERQRVPALDAARFLAALAVLLYHYGYHGGVTGKYLDTYVPALGRATLYGYLGVNAFFVISGFVIAWTARGATAARFVRGRWLRVYPTFVFAACATALVILVAGNPRFRVTLPQWLAHAFVDARRLGQPYLDGVYWSIVCELQFYAMVAIGLALPALRRHAAACLWLWLGLSAANEFAWQQPRLSSWAMTGFAPLFVLGMCLFRRHAGDRGRGNLAMGGVALALALAFELRHAGVRFGAFGTAWSPAAVAALLLAAIALIAFGTRWRFGARVEQALERVGAITYPLYLLHATIGFIAIDALARRWPPPAAIAVTAIGMIAVSAFVAWQVEPVLKRVAAGALSRLASRLAALRHDTRAVSAHPGRQAADGTR